jgi:hypothetical protein
MMSNLSGFSGPSTESVSDENQSQCNDETALFTLNTLAEMTGFPIHLIKKELLLSDDMGDNEPLPLELLRQAMLKYLDSSI